MLEEFTKQGDYFQSQLAINKIFFFCLSVEDILNIARKYTIYPSSFNFIYRGKVCIDLLHANPPDSYHNLRKIIKKIEHAKNIIDLTQLKGEIAKLCIDPPAGPWPIPNPRYPRIM